MTHPLTPREKVEPFERYPALASWIAKMASVGSGLSLGEWMTFVGALNAAIVQAEQRTAIASGSGDHAEQVEDAMEALQIIDAFPSNQGEVEGRITEKGDRMLSSCTRDVRRALETLLAENAALRAEHVHLVEEVSRSQARLHAATEAERKLAEAVGLLGTLSLMFHPDSAHGRHVRTFLECSR